MIWLIDIGNSRLKVATVDSKKGLKIRSTCRPKAGDQIFVSSVVPKKVRELTKLWRKRRAHIHFVSVKDLKAKFAYRSGFGLDRALQVWGGMQKFSKPFVVIGAGTAITVDFVSHKKAHFGGWIVAGPQVLASALHQKTAQLPAVTFKNEAQAFGRSTETSLSCGQAALFRGFLKEALRQFDQYYPSRSYEIIVSGGNARALSKLFDSSRKVRVREYFVLECLAEYARAYGQQTKR